ncbi:MAG: hypothetical protein K6T27_01145, partial [Thermoleophilum sp.]|nr:hypothetical protein [Thermoleophilum sp.]
PWAAWRWTRPSSAGFARSTDWSSAGRRRRAGAGWWRLVRSSGRKRLLVGTLVLGYSYLLLTRPLGAMAMTAAIGLVALLVVVLLAERLPVPSGEKIDQ